MDLSERLWRRKLQLLQRYREDEQPADGAEDAAAERNDEDWVGFHDPSALTVCKERLAVFLAARYDSVPQLEEAKSLMQEVTAAGAKHHEALLSEMLAGRRTRRGTGRRRSVFRLFTFRAVEREQS